MSGIKIRLETPEDYKITEDITREAFWNRFQPGADEHYLLHQIRKSNDYVHELGFVAEVNGIVVGNIAYTKSSILDISGNLNQVLTFGPISVHPNYQQRGIGSTLIRHSLKVASSLGYSGVVIFGDPRYYGRLGFRCAERYDITTRSGQFSLCMLAYPLQPGAFDHIAGAFQESIAFENFMEGFEEFEKQFEEKEKFVTESQKEFDILRSLIYRKEIDDHE